MSRVGFPLLFPSVAWCWSPILQLAVFHSGLWLFSLPWWHRSACLNADAIPACSPFFPTSFLTLIPIFSSSVPWLLGKCDQREPCKRRQWDWKVRLGYLPSMLPWQNGFTADREGSSMSYSTGHCSSPRFSLLSSYMVLFCSEMGSHQIAH